MIRLWDIRIASALMMATMATAAAVSWFFAQYSTPDLSSRPAIPWSPASSSGIGGSMVSAPVDMTEALDRPLFRMPREPFSQIVEVTPAPELVPDPAPVALVQPDPVPAQPAPEQVQQLVARLTGVSIVGTLSKALLVTQDQPQGGWIGIGDRLNEFEVLEITPVSVRLRGPAGDTVLQLYVDNADEAIGTVSTPQ